jgi:hypothetical protein
VEFEDTITLIIKLLNYARGVISKHALIGQSRFVSNFCLTMSVNF